jgi:hypothetical protein
MVTGREGADVEFELDEPGFQGVLRIEEREGGRHVVLSGIRPDSSEAAIEKDLPADRDEGLARLAQRCVGGDAAAAVEVLAHVGVLDPE